MGDQCLGLAGRRIVDHQPTVGSALDDVECVRRHLIARRAVAEVDLAVGRDIEIVGHAQARVVVELVLGAVRLVGDLEDSAVGLDSIDAHPGDANDEVLLPVELHAERSAADMRKHLASL
jgi:hypothetical protein